MFKKLAAIFGDPNEKELRRLQSTVDKIDALEPDFEGRSDDDLRAKSVELRDRLHSRKSPDDILPEAFALVREASRRTLGQRHFDVQLLGGIVIHQGKIAEMKTGEGKTLAATLPVYLNSLTGNGVHVVTVNDYLSKRDTQWMGPIYHLLGVSVGCIQHESAFLFDPSYNSGDVTWPHLRPSSRREAYLADVTYGTNNEFGFDYLRDNMVPHPSLRVQRGFNFSIVDEVDNILIDEARTPLIISGQAEESTQRYYTFARLIPRLQADHDYKIDERMRTAILTEAGIARMEKWLGIGNLYDPENYALVHYMENALRAHVFYRRDREYMVKNGEVIIVDEFTGRLMFGRRYSEGLHQAIEAKEGVKIQRESRTMATITFQNYFRMYQKLSGMTGTAATEAEEFFKIYKLDVVVIPTNRPLIRREYEDQIYKNEEAKFRAVVREIEESNRQGRPLLIGTLSIEKSEHLSEMLARQGIPHQVLNAKYHEKEARIIAQAGRLGAVTIATNMAGRGVDIILGGNPQDREQGEWQEEHNKVVELGGLHIIGTERHEARRIDNQLRGRAGRQGDPGSSRFYVSLGDDIMRRFGGDKIKGFMEWAGLDENIPIEHSLVSKAIENTQVKVEAYHFDVRKHLLDYDDVLNRHRERIYLEREKVLSGADLKSSIRDMIERTISDLVLASLSDEHGDEWNLDWLLTAVGAIFPPAPELGKDNLAHMSRSEIEDQLLHYAGSVYDKREQEIGSDNMRILERLVTLRAIDTHWVEHLTALEDVRRGIGLYAYAQRDPLVAYKKEAHEMFQHLQAGIQHDIVHTIYRAGILKQTPLERKQPVGQKVGRNDPCPCGSGKKYKKCCGR